MVIRDKESHYLIIGDQFIKKIVTIINLYAHNIGTSQYIKQILTRLIGNIKSNTVIERKFNTPHAARDK